MKKIFALFLSLTVICLAAAGCKSGNTKNSSIKMTRDLSVKTEKVYSAPGSGANIIGNASQVDVAYPEDLKTQTSVSEYVIRGTVQNVTFTSFQGIAWTKSEVLITDSFKGDLKVGDLITVFNLGGYIPLSDHIAAFDDAFRFSDLSAEQIKNTYLNEITDGEKVIQKSDDLILCLVEPVEGSPLPEGSYERLSYAGQLRAEGNEKFVQTLTDGDTQKEFSYNEIKKITK